jgi:hypothetical protein
MIRAGPTSVERAVTYEGFEIIEKLAAILKVDPAVFLRRPTKARGTRSPGRFTGVRTVTFTE